MKIAIIGSGISGLSAADHLASNHDVTLFEANEQIGGHADTHEIIVGNKHIAVDTGFIVFNPDNYPTFMELLNKYQVEYKDSDMSFAVSNRLSGLEYNASSIDQLFCQRKNLLKPSFYRMVKDIFRFYKESPSLLDQDTEISLGDYLQQNNYSPIFINEHIIPMTCALWSGDTKTIFDFPAKFLVAFMQNHQMMQAFDRPVWKTISGGSRQYLKAIERNAEFVIRTNTPVKRIKRHKAGVELELLETTEQFDKVIFACHSDQALRLLDTPTAEEQHVLGAIAYQENTICLHSDTAVLPKKCKAWASWNVIIDESSSKQCTVSYYMNLLQSLATDVPVIVSLNMQQKIDPNKIWKTITYHHPIYNKSTIRAQQNKHLVQGKEHSYFCGAYWGWGFHEDGAISGKQAALELEKDAQDA
ncbi:MAG: FAD-dependent oxidoreductase [Gammaproteobacteria bacterium]|nr:FAD-dependent oxidoreductase [Gammaproteobacteria bacterium]